MFFVILHNSSLQLLILVRYEFVRRQICVIGIVFDNIITALSCKCKVHSIIIVHMKPLLVLYPPFRIPCTM